MNTLKQTALAAALALPTALSAGSGALASSWECDSGPESGWKSIEEARAVVIAAGYETGKTKVKGGCYEFYSKKDGKKAEVFVNPATLKIVHVTVK